MARSDHEDEGSNTNEENDESSGEVNWSDERPRKPSEQLVGYLKSVGGSLDSALDEEERAALLRNVFEEVKGHEASVACSRATCYIFENLIREAKLKQCVVVLENTKKYFGFLCNNRQGSHVVETLLTRMYDCFYVLDKSMEEDEIDSESEKEDADKEEGEEDGTEKAATALKIDPAFEELRVLVGDLCKTLTLKEIWWDLIFDPSASHVFRTLLCFLARKDPRLLKKKRALDSEEFDARRRKKDRRADPEFIGSLHAFLGALAKSTSDDVKQACTNHYSSPAIQLLLASCSPKNKAWKQLFDKILCPAGGTTCDVSVFDIYSKDRVASHMMETLVSKCDDEVFENVIFSQCIKGRMLKLLDEPTANFVLQHALGNIRTKEQFDSALEELEDELISSLLKNRLGVVWHLCRAAKLGDKAGQNKICRGVIRGIRARESNSKRSSDASPVGAIESLLEVQLSSKSSTKDSEQTNAENNEEEAVDAFQRVNVSVIGSRVAGALLELPPESSRAIFESVASMSVESLRVCCTDPVAGKSVMETLMEAPQTASWAKQRVLQKLKDDIVNLATNRFGHLFIRKAFDNGAQKDKSLIAKCLLKGERKLTGSRFGKSVAHHCKISLFRKDASQWESAIKHTTAHKKRKVVENMLADLEATAVKNKAHKKARKE